MSRHNVPSVQRGFGIVEVMVAMVIALIGMIVIFQIFEISESYNRTAMSGSDAQQNGAYSLYVMQSEIRQAGWGFNNSQALGCNVLAYNATLGGPPAQLTPGSAPAYVLAPVVIDPAAAGTASDVLEVNYGNQNLLVAPVQMYQNQSVRGRQSLRLRRRRFVPCFGARKGVHARPGHYSARCTVHHHQPRERQRRLSLQQAGRLWRHLHDQRVFV